MGMGAMAAGAGTQGAASITSGIVGANSAKAQGAYQSAMYNINAGLAGMQSEQALRQGGIASTAAIGKTKQLIGAQRSAAASQGVDANVGSAAVAQADAAGIGAMDALTIKNNAYLKAFGYQSQAIQSSASGEFAEIGADASANATILTGGIGAVSAGFKAGGFMGGGYSNTPGGGYN